MIPTIGLMIGCYIMLRCISFATRSGDIQEGLLVRILSVIVLLIALFCVIDLIMTGMKSPAIPPVGLR
jgi:hypothetical protein